MMLDLPHVIDAETIGQFDLVQRFLEEPLLVPFRPGARQLMLIKQPEFQ
jgi:hypothetical protein